MGIGNDNDYKVSCSVQKRSSFRAPTLWFIDLAVATCHIQYTFCVYAIFIFFGVKTDKTSKFICITQKWPPTVTRHTEH